MVDFNGFDKGVIGKPLPADSTLNNMKKNELIELLHLAESNHKVLADAIDRILYRQMRNGSSWKHFRQSRVVTGGTQMSKSVLVIDTPITCMRCPFGLFISDYIFCVITIDKDGAAKQIRNDLYGIKRQNWCPLKLLPEKDTKNHFPDEFEDGYATGWNACIDEITGDD